MKKGELVKEAAKKVKGSRRNGRQLIILETATRSVWDFGLLTCFSLSFLIIFIIILGLQFTLGLDSQVGVLFSNTIYITNGSSFDPIIYRQLSE